MFTISKLFNSLFTLSLLGVAFSNSKFINKKKYNIN